MISRLLVASLTTLAAVNVALAAPGYKATPNAPGAGGTAGESVRGPIPRYVHEDAYRYPDLPVGGKGTWYAPGAGGTSASE